MEKEYYKKVLEELLEKHYDKTDDMVCGLCGLVIYYYGNSCDLCHMGICWECEKLVCEGGVFYENWYVDEYSYMVCYKCYPKWLKQNPNKKDIRKCECFSNDVFDYECSYCKNNFYIE